MIYRLFYFFRVPSLLLGAIAVWALWVNSALLLGALALAPSAPYWQLVLLLGGVWSIIGVAQALQDGVAQALQDRVKSRAINRLLTAISGSGSGAILGFYTLGELKEQQLSKAMEGAGMGAVVLGAVAIWAYGSIARPSFARRWGRAVITLCSCSCVYGLAFGLGSWIFFAVSTGHWTLAGMLLGPAVLSWWITRRSLGRLYGQWRSLGAMGGASK